MSTPAPAPLTERVEPATVTERGPIHATVTGTFLKKDAVSLNNRFYPADTVERAVEKAQARIAQEGAIPLQQLVKHGSADSDESLEVVGRLSRVWMDGDLARYEADIPNTAAGRDTATLVQGGFLNTVSLRAEPGSAKVERGKLGERDIDIVRDFDLAGIDYTLYPGIRDDARVESIQIFESVDPAQVERGGAGQLREEAAPGAAWAHDWYETITEAALAGLLEGRAIDTIQREYLPLYEAKFEKPGHYTKKDREKIADEDFAGPGDTFPIVTQQDVHDAARLIGHAADPAAVKRKVIAIAKRKGFSLPDAWQSKSKAKESAMPDQNATQAAASASGTTDATATTESTTTTPTTAPALNEANMHSHAHQHDGMADGYPMTYTHEHAHGHDSNEMAMHDSREAHRHGHAAESATGTHMHAVTTEAGTAGNASLLEAIARLIDERVGAAVEARLPQADGLDAPTRQALETARQTLGATLTEKGAAISAANRQRLQAAHDGIAQTLGMECASGPGGAPLVPDTDNDGESASTAHSGVKLLEQLITRAVASALPAPTTPAQTTTGTTPAAQAAQGAAREGGQAQAGGADGFRLLAEAMTKLAESQAATQGKLDQLAEALPERAARAAAEVAWRPERKTALAENRDANQPGGGPGAGAADPTVREQLSNRDIPIEKRIKMAADGINAHLPELMTLQALGAFSDD